MKILLVEDDEATATVLASALTDDRHTVNIASDGQMGLMLAETYDYDLVLLDVLIPKLDGITICRKLRSQGLQMPILLLTAKDSQTDKVMGLDAGADDYVVKPFDLPELKARIRALLRRSNSPLSTLLTWENLCLDPNSNEVTYNGKPIALTPKEYGILEIFLRYPQRVFSRSAIIDRLWTMDDSPGESAVTTHIKDLRQKLKAGGMKTDLIETVYGLGYRLKPSPIDMLQEQQKEPAPAASASPALPSQIPPAPPLPLPSSSVPDRQKGLASLNRVIERFKTSFTAQVAVLRQADYALQTGQLTSDLREQARQEAHKLAGSLGIFGYPEGSRLAREAEYLLVDEIFLYKTAKPQFSQIVASIEYELTKPPRTNTPEVESPQDSQRSHPVFEKHARPARPDHLGQGTASPILWQHSPLVLVADSDHILTEQMRARAMARGMHIETVADLDAARQAISQLLPDAVLLDLTQTSSTQQELARLTELTAEHPSLPILIFTGQNSLADRVAASRLGVKAFLHKPMPVEQILQAIEQVLPQSLPVAEAKVLIVDDDLTVLRALSALLQPWGLQVTTLDDSRRFWDVLVATEPDLVVFDLEMPTFNGIDLCRVVRHDPHWGDLPILVVTAHTDADSIRSVFAAGADDFIAKPVVGPELVTRILSRIERVRAKQNGSAFPSPEKRLKYDKTAPGG